MRPKLKRSELDGLAEFYSLDSRRTETMLELAGAHPSRAEAIHFFANCLRIAGVLSLAAALVFFVAANWSRIAVFGRFALVEIVLIACVAVAFARPPPAFIGRGATFLAFIASGALLALFGQTYQTGADVYELFLGWALLGLPLVVAAQWSVATAAWVLVLDTALVLFCGGHPTGGLIWLLLDGFHVRPALLIMAAAWANLALWFALEIRPIDAAPDWVRRLILSCAFGFGTWGGVLGVLGERVEFETVGGDPATVFALAVAMAVVTVYALRRRTDVYPLAVVMGTFIVVSLVWLARVAAFHDEGTFLFLALWLIGTSTAAGKILTSLTRRWRAGTAG
ncbi:MAG TPA: DUF2157 domain-containing protein [Steroidobacteraceae bacterium]|jgi:uncharacterized membrane protein|nr:DUF2157 domain-containing protein [Steroidobacteraceae bacterium]